MGMAECKLCLPHVCSVIWVSLHQTCHSLCWHELVASSGWNVRVSPIFSYFPWTGESSQTWNFRLDASANFFFSLRVGGRHLSWKAWRFQCFRAPAAGEQGIHVCGSALRVQTFNGHWHCQMWMFGRGLSWEGSSRYFRWLGRNVKCRFRFLHALMLSEVGGNIRFRAWWGYAFKVLIFGSGKLAALLIKCPGKLLAGTAFYGWILLRLNTFNWDWCTELDTWEKYVLLPMYGQWRRLVVE